MFLFDSMFNISIYITIAAALFIFITVRENPLKSAGFFVQAIFTSSRVMFTFLGLLIILVLNKLELRLENMMQYDVDFTPIIHQLEGNLVYTIQNLYQHEVLTLILVIFYVILFPALLIASLAIYIHTNQTSLYFALIYAMMLNYAIAIPFYLFFPVNEVWYHLKEVRFLMLDVFPKFEEEYRPLSGLNNCFPSLHTSISVTLAVIASRSNIKLWKWITSISAIIIIFSIFYLGIHWITDMFAGVILGLVASSIGMKVSELSQSKSYPQLPIQGLYNGRNSSKM